MSQIRAHLDAQSKLEESARIPLDRPEKFLHQMAQIPEFDERVACIIFEDTFNESTENVDGKLHMLDQIIEVFKTGDEIRAILGMILRIGNYLNGGNRTR